MQTRNVQMVSEVQVSNMEDNYNCIGCEMECCQHNGCANPQFISDRGDVQEGVCDHHENCDNCGQYKTCMFKHHFD